MKKTNLKWVALILAAALLAGCQSPSEESAATDEPTASTTAPAETEVPAPTEAEVPAATEDTTPTEPQPEETPEDSTYREYIETIYAEPISLYKAALSAMWEEGKYFENDMSPLASYYYDANPLDNVGYALMDLNNDGCYELLIGAMQDAQNPILFELWTWTQGSDAPTRLAVSHAKNCYFLMYYSEEGVYMIANEGSNGAANSAHHYYSLQDGGLAIMQGIVYDATADEANPWFMASDDDWDTSNDSPIDEQMALGIIDANTAAYILPEYTPFSSIQ